MYVDNKKGRNKEIFVFYFKNQEDFDKTILAMEAKKESLTEKGIEILDRYIQLLKSRVDNKYANDESELSGCLFLDEASSLMTILMVLL